MSDKDKSSKKKYHFGKNEQENIIYKQYFTTQARNTNTTIKQYEKDCRKSVKDYKIVCKSWKTILGDIPEKKFDDPSICQLSEFKNKQLDQMSLQELNFYSKNIKDIIIIIQDCVIRRSQFKNKCIPPNLRDKGHETRIENVIKLKSNCKNQLLKILQQIELKSNNIKKKAWGDPGFIKQFYKINIE